MRYKPSQSEREAVCADTASARFQYFMHCVVESEEVWALGDGSGWITRTVEGRDCLPIWPYQEYASECIAGEWDDQSTQEMSLEQFIHKVLQLLKDEDMDVEIFPTPEKHGQLVPAQQLLEFLESTLDAGEYYMEG